MIIANLAEWEALTESDKLELARRREITHTPEPWTVHGTEIRYESNGVEYPIASVSYIIPYKEAGADARLIALAPRMYDYIAMRASLGDNEAKNLLKELGYAEGETSK